MAPKVFRVNASILAHPQISDAFQKQPRGFPQKEKREVKLCEVSCAAFMYIAQNERRNVLGFGYLSVRVGGFGFWNCVEGYECVKKMKQLLDLWLQFQKIYRIILQRGKWWMKTIVLFSFTINLAFNFSKTMNTTRRYDERILNAKQHSNHLAHIRRFIYQIWHHWLKWVLCLDNIFPHSENETTRCLQLLVIY